MAFDYRTAFPLVDFNHTFDFSNCLNRLDFLNRCIDIYYQSIDLREKESALAVYMAVRDHYPTLLINIDENTKNELNAALLKSSPKIIKLRRLVISALSKAS